MCLSVWPEEGKLRAAEKPHKQHKLCKQKHSDEEAHVRGNRDPKEDERSVTRQSLFYIYSQ